MERLTPDLLALLCGFFALIDTKKVYKNSTKKALYQGCKTTNTGLKKSIKKDHPSKLRKMV